MCMIQIWKPFKVGTSYWQVFNIYSWSLANSLHTLCICWSLNFALQCYRMSFRVFYPTDSVWVFVSKWMGAFSEEICRINNAFDQFASQHYDHQVYWVYTCMGTACYKTKLLLEIPISHKGDSLVLKSNLNLLSHKYSLEWISG